MGKRYRGLLVVGGRLHQSAALPIGSRSGREDQESLANDAGMVIKQGVSRKLDTLVLADPDGRSGIAKAADEMGVRKMAEPVFWRALGVEID
jgi:NAD-dependent DNA ligase